MLRLPTIFFMSVIAMTSATNDASQDLNLSPLSEMFYMFDVISDAPYDDIRCSFGSITVRHSFKVIGEARYRFVAQSEDMNALAELTFPKRSVVTQYLLQHASDYFKMYDSEAGWMENGTQPALPDDAILIMSDLKIVFPHGTHSDEVKWRIANHGKAFTSLHDQTSMRSFENIGSYPTQGFYFVKMDLNALQNSLKDGMDTLGGPASYQHQLKHVVQVTTQPAC